MPKNTQDVLEAQVDPMTIISQLRQQMQTDSRQAEEDRKLMMSTIADIMKTVKDNQLTPSSSTTIVSGPDNDFYQLKKDLPQFTFNEEEGQTFEYWFRRYSPAIRDRGMVLPEDKKRDLIIEKLDEVAYRGYAEDILPSVPQDFGYDETVEKLKKLFGPKKTLIRRRFECLKIMCPPASETYMPFRDFANSVKRMTENVQLKELDYEGLKTLLFIAGLQDSTLSDVRLRMLAKLDSYAGSTPLTIDSLVSECENFMTLKVDNRDMGAANINAVRRRRNSYKQYRKPFEPNRQVSSDIHCFDCSKRHRWNNCPLKAHTHHDVKDSNKSAIPKRQQRTRGFRCKNVKLPNNNKFGTCPTMATVTINGVSRKVQIDSGANITLISQATWTMLGSPTLEPCPKLLTAANGAAMTVYGRFTTDFTIMDRSTGKVRGHGYCYVTDDCDLIGVEWAIFCPSYRSMHGNLHCQRATTGDIDSLRETIITSLKTKYGSVFEPGLGRCVVDSHYLFYSRESVLDLRETLG